ncbi:hypothetical protein CEP52_015538 [Fusarium oligoseptatum]|uniref:Modin n=1 Tax=Fusarium oligoseptatum TaxID=2604345 RepID=A0A428SC56_9HYPO|nr:hypothetical protein CEP52_015538 [Fusarium oligoseptatum]
MSSETGSPTPTSSGNGDDNTELIVAVVALVISVLAFVIAILQALQQYFASATGFSSCSPAVVGKWANFARRQMLWTEFRFEVQFEVPVIFVARPENKKGPLGDDELTEDKDRKIIRLDGGEDNFQYTSKMEEFDKQFKQSQQQVVHTADNEKGYLSKLEDSYKTNGPRLLRNNTAPPDAPAPSHSMVVCMQRKRRTWDSMPNNISKPYATTTISHLVEIAAMLGIYWRQFDLNNDQYRAQGNGFVIYGSYVDGLGITFTFQKQGPTWFKQNRVIPNYDVKKYCFGIAPTIFLAPDKDRVYADEPKDVGSLQLGSLSEIAHSLEVFGCGINTVNYFRKNLDQARHSHIFPIPFEILGMVGKTLHVKDTVFRMLPNPTIFYWDPNTFSMPTLMAEFLTSLRLLHSEKLLKDSKQVADILNWADSHDSHFTKLRASSSTLVNISEDISGVNLVNELNHLRTGIELCDDFFEPATFSLDNTKKDGEDDEEGPITIEDLDSAFVNEKEALLIQMYFETVRQNVSRILTEQDDKSKKRQARRARRGSVNSGKAGEAGVKPPQPISERQVNEIWCTLVFRMLCWLQLHEFHKMDIQVSKSDAYASRIPVYIV